MNAQGSPRLSLEGFRIRKVKADPQAGHAPQVLLQLSKRDYPAAGLDPFSPFRLPEHVDLVLQDVDSSLVQQASGDLDITLQAGTHRFPLAGGEHFLIEVQEGTHALSKWEVGALPSSPVRPSLLARVLAPHQPESPARRPPAVVRWLELTFSHPLRLPNLIPTLLEVQELFADRALSELLGGPITTRTAQITHVAQLLGGERVLDRLNAAAGSAHRFGVVLLRQVRAEPIYRARSGQWELRLSFSGHAQIAGRVPIPFSNVVLPALVLPVPFASLDELLSDNPLASADLRKDRVRVDEAVEGLRSIVSHITGSFSVRTELPSVAVQAQAVDRTELQATVALPSPLAVQGSFEGHFEKDDLILQAEQLTLGFPESEVRLNIRAQLQDQGKAAPIGERWSLHLENTLCAGSELPWLDIKVQSTHPQAIGSSELTLGVRNVRIDAGAGGLSVLGHTIELWPMSRRVAFSAEIGTKHALDLGDVGLQSTLQTPSSPVSGSLELRADGQWHLALDTQTSYALSLVQKVPCVPELGINAGELSVLFQGKAKLQAAAQMAFAPTNAFDLQVQHALLHSVLDTGTVTLHDRRLVVPAGTELSLKPQQAAFTSRGMDDLAVEVAWNMHSQPCLLHAGLRSASLLTPELREGQMTVHLSSEGRLSFSGERQGLYGIRYFNSLLNPMADPEHLAEILRSDEALRHVFSALELLSPSLASDAELLQDMILGVRTIAKRIGIYSLKEFIPRHSMARMMSLALAGDESCAERIAAQAKRATEGEGLDVIEVKNIVRPYLDEFGADYEIDGVIRWLNTLLTAPAPQPEELAIEQVPLALSDQYAPQLKDLPSAADIYQKVAEPEVQASFVTKLCRLAVLLTAEQIEYVLRHSTPAWGLEKIQWLRYVHSVKRRVNRIALAYGGTEYALQGVIISTFLGEAISTRQDPVCAPEEQWTRAAHWPPACALGPEEVASLLKAGLAINRQGRQAQINNRMLLDLLRHRPGQFTLEVLVELGQDNPIALSGILFAFLDQEQDHMRQPLDLPALLESKLQMPVPRRLDFMAGGRRPRESYYEALVRLAEAVMAKAEPVIARKSHLQVQRHPVPASYRPKARLRSLTQAAKDAIQSADQAASGCDFTSRRAQPQRKKARALYEQAFARCAELLAQDPLAFQAPWLKAFWQRNEEALKLLSVVRNYQQDVDRVRPWLHRRTGQGDFASEQDLLLAVLQTLILTPQDRHTLAKDPLVRLLIDPEPGQYDFTVVSCMGVITEGAQGTELDASFERLQQQRGVRIVRAPTGTAMSLETNAERIIQCLAKIDGPFGLIGYSQGCANALAAESLLRGGTPDQQKLIEQLVCRNLLFSAFNGSPHGSFGTRKFLEALIEGERFLKHYQVLFSSEVVGAFLRVLRAALDSPLFVQVLAGVHSLTPRRAMDFHREMQLVEHAPTSTVRGAISEEWLPETLEFTFHLLRQMTGGAPQDTQVLLRDSVGHSTRVLNDTMRLLQRCDMGSCPQVTHHWSPLLKETTFVTTERDLERGVYDLPKDRHLFPWIEVNARFGRIRRSG